MNLLQWQYQYLRSTIGSRFYTVRRYSPDLPWFNIHIRLQTALLLEKALTAYRTEQPLADYDGWLGSSWGPRLHIDSGEPIERGEWEDIWSEGERPF
jgi:hypothetical protein